MSILTKGGLIIGQTSESDSSSTPSTFAVGDVESAFGRSGDVVAQEGDYVLDQMGDVDTTTVPPVNKDFLSWDGTNWTPGDTLDSGTFP